MAQTSTGEGDEGGPLRQRALRSLGLLAAALVLVVAGGLLAGWLYAKGSPQRAAATVVGPFVTDEPNLGAQPPPEGDASPTSGTYDGAARCGRSAGPVTVGDQLATLATGAVLVQFRPGDVDADLPLLDELADRGDVLVAPNAQLHDPVVATAWTRRMALPAPTAELLLAFVTAHRGTGPDAAAPCPGSARD